MLDRHIHTQKGPLRAFLLHFILSFTIKLMRFIFSIKIKGQLLVNFD